MVVKPSDLLRGKMKQVAQREEAKSSPPPGVEAPSKPSSSSGGTSSRSTSTSSSSTSKASSSSSSSNRLSTIINDPKIKATLETIENKPVETVKQEHETITNKPNDFLRDTSKKPVTPFEKMSVQEFQQHLYDR